jgi:tetratricopeptide (TPR) repeat protein
MTGRQDLFDESMRLGHSAAWDLQWSRAIEFYRKALAEFPEDPTALTSLGLALFETEQFKDALGIYHKAAKFEPEDPIPVEKCAEIFERLGQINDSIQQRKTAAERYLARKDAQKALENWAHIARLTPDDLTTRSRLAMTYERTGRSRQAVHEYLAVASILQRAGKIARAEEAVQRALRIIPGDPEVNKALRMLQTGRPLPAPVKPRGATAPLRMAKVQEFLKSESADIAEEDRELADPEVSAQRQALTILAGMLFDEPKDENGESSDAPSMSALTSGRPRIGRKPVGQPQMYRYLGQAIDLQTRGHKSQAIKDYERAFKAGLDHPAAHYNIGILYKETEDIESARKHLISALGHPELDLGANLALGRISRSQEEMREAARYLLQGLRLADALSVDESQSASLNQFYDSILASQTEGDDEALAQIVEGTLRFLSGPDWLQRLRQARLQLESQRPNTNVVPIAEMLAVGGTERVLNSLAHIDDYIAKGLLNPAMEEAMLSLDHAPTYLALHSRMADILIQSGEIEDGLAKLLVIADTHQVRGEIQQACEVYFKILELAPINVAARSQLIEMLIQQERYQDSLEQYLELAEIYRQMAEIDAARKVLASALRLSQDVSIGQDWSLKILMQMGDIDRSRLDWRRALRVYVQARTIDPSNEDARSHVIDLNLRLGQEEQAAQELDSYLEYLVEKDRGSEALSLIEDMAREHPGKRVLHARLAEAYRAAGRKADSIAQYDALGEIQLDAGQVQEAIQTIETIVKLDPPDIEGYEELLRNLKGKG